MTNPRASAAALGACSLPAIADSAGGAARFITGLRPLDRRMAVAGPAFPVAGMSGDNLALHRALDQCPRDYVLVATVQGGRTAGHWGGLMTAAARQKGILGVVIDGTVRDADEIRDLEFPVFATGLHPVRCRKEHRGELNVPIACAGVGIGPGDMVIGDEHGVLVLAPNELASVAKQAHQSRQREEGIVQCVRRGERLATLLGLDLS